ncbi:hypothetical protein DPMN_167761 [Dreissena polymorpha]|uniref:Reverse transcriptase domain-containing protein n=1 Tax=Dreissena polymorpha TaxID=45954 RepID=A0A9D4F0U6_DREPO|nr:hypothetical protein DPMN_167761 [Dreissena polymorpha]
MNFGDRYPLSSSLFIISIEYLSHYIQSNKHINGISIEPDEEIKQSLFADDRTYFLNDNYDSFHNLIESLTLFGLTSGLKLNKSKCTVLRTPPKLKARKIISIPYCGDESYGCGVLLRSSEYMQSIVNQAEISSRDFHSEYIENTWLVPRWTKFI